MRLEDECRLSYYKQIADLDSEHEVYLVQNQENKRIYVKKVLKTYNEEVYCYLKDRPIPNMPHIYEAVADNDRLIVIEEYLSGMTLQQLIDEGKTFEVQEVIRIIAELCNILNDLHNAHPPIIHRDIKPSNIIISPDGVVKLIDMNAAKWGIRQSGIDTTLIGTAGYAAPEQYGFAVSNIKTDIYAVGVLINVMQTGVPPVERLAREPLDHIVSCCTKMNQDERYDSILDLKRELLRSGGQKEEDHKNFRHTLAPPGCRSGNPVAVIFSLLGYFLLFMLAISTEVDGSSTAALWVQRIGIVITFFAVVFFCGNYMGIRDKLKLPAAKNKALRFLQNVLLGIVVFFVGIMLTAVIGSAFT